MVFHVYILSINKMLLLIRIDKLWAHQASYPMGTGVLSLGVELKGHEADHSLSI
jgi:hypothetical protein